MEAKALLHCVQEKMGREVTVSKDRFFFFFFSVLFDIGEQKWIQSWKKM